MSLPYLSNCSNNIKKDIQYVNWMIKFYEGGLDVLSLQVGKLFHTKLNPAFLEAG